MDAKAQASVAAQELEGNRKVQEHMRKMQELGVFKVARATMPPSERRQSLRSAHHHGDQHADPDVSRAAPRRPSASEWSWDDDDASNDSFTHRVADSAVGAAVAAGRSPAGPAFVKLMLPSHVAGGYWLQAPFGLADFLPATTCGVILACDGEEWKTTWLVRSANNGSLSGGWRGFAVDQRLAVGDALTFTKEPGLRLRVTVHRARRFESRDDGDDGGDAARDAAREAAFAEAAAHTDALFANHGAKPGAAVTVAGAPDPLPGGGTAARSHVYSRRREGRRDAAASAAARARAAASPDECAEMAARAAFDDDVERSAANLERVEEISNASPRASPAHPPAGAHIPFASPRIAVTRAKTNAKTNVATPAITMDALGSPACTPAPPPTATRAGAERAAAIAAARAPLRPGAARRVDPAPLETPASPLVVGAPSSSSRRGDVAAIGETRVGSRLDREPDREPHRDAREARAKKRPRRQTPTHVSFATGAAPMEGWNTPASARSATEAAMARRVFGRERRRADVTPADATTKLSEVKTDAPPPAPEPAAKVRRARRGIAAAAAAAETTPSRGRGAAASTPNGTPLSQVFRSTKQRNPASAFLTPVSKTKARTAAGASGGGGGTKTPPRRGVRVAAPVRGGAFVGRRISRYWNGERRWFRGTLVEYTAGNGYRVEYDDGDVEEGVEFPDESVRVLPLGSDGAKTR